MNRPKRAIALEYDGFRAPRISAMGTGDLADQIVALAREHGVPMMENEELAVLLSQLDLGDEIPDTLYRCVAQIIAFAYRVRGRFPDGWTHEDDDATGPVHEHEPGPESESELKRLSAPDGSPE